MGEVSLTPLVNALLLITGVIVSVTDLARRKIYNVVTFPMILVGLALNAWPSAGRVAAGDWHVGVFGFVVGFGILFLPFAVGMLKAGDVKYLAGVGAIGGPWVALFTFLYGSVAHGVLCLAVLARRGEVKVAFSNIGYWFSRSALLRKPADFEARTQGKVPFALSLAVGVAATLLSVQRCGNVFWRWV